MLVAERRMVMGKAHVFHVGSLSKIAFDCSVASLCVASLVFSPCNLWKLHARI